LLGAAAASGALVAGGLTLPKALPAKAQRFSAQATRTFSTTTPITIQDQQVASPYPSAINVTGMPGAIGFGAAVVVGINGLSHPRLKDIQMCLVSPRGTPVWLMGSVGAVTTSASNMHLRISDSAPGPLPPTDFLSGSYQPANYDPLQNTQFPFPAPTNVTSTTLASFAGLAGSDLNGAWKLFIRDSERFVAGSLAGWSLTITTDKNFPVLRNDSYRVNAGETLTVKRPGVLENDTDETGTLRLTKVIRRTNRLGRLTVKRNGALTFVARRNVSGTFRFRYRARSTSGFTGTARVTIRVTR
jgi:subtilisin-like proprotein convertase family protein